LQAAFGEPRRVRSLVRDQAEGFAARSGLRREKPVALKNIGGIFPKRR
jgi:hypothetical protein